MGFEVTGMKSCRQRRLPIASAQHSRPDEIPSKGDIDEGCLFSGEHQTLMA
jgi:hypothetical protein